MAELYTQLFFPIKWWWIVSKPKKYLRIGQMLADLTNFWHGLTAGEDAHVAVQTSEKRSFTSSICQSGQQLKFLQEYLSKEILS